MFPYSQIDLRDPRQTAPVVIWDAITNIAFTGFLAGIVLLLSKLTCETYSRKTLAEQEDAFWLLNELHQELAREQESRHAEQGIASKAYKYVAGENDLTVMATVKPGRYPGSFELTEIEA
jgi:hypothetical protein